MLPLRYQPPILPLRPASQFPEYARMVSFWHPSTRELLLKLPANDVSTPDVFGLHHGTALLACLVLAYNKTGCLSTSSNPTDISSRHAGTRDSLLFENNYYYHVPSDPLYEICRSFSEWPFPHDSYTQVWESRQLNPGTVALDLRTDGASHIIKERDRVCPISQNRYSLTMSHIVPRSQSDWVRVLNVISLVKYVELFCTS
jgi:hypothetical protein